MGSDTLTYLQNFEVRNILEVYKLKILTHNLTHDFVSSFQLILVFHSMSCTGDCGYSF